MDHRLNQLRLFSSERAYVDTLRHRERADLVRIVERNHKRARVSVPLRIQVLQSSLPEETRACIFDELGRDCSEKYATWVRGAIRLPLGVHHRAGGAPDVSEAVARAKVELDRHVTGHETAKREALKLVCQMHAKGIAQGGTYALGLEGLPGTGKTHFVKNAMANALQRPFVSIPLGGATDVSFLMGSLYVYEGSKEGRLVAGLVEAGCCNPVIHFDEVDKVSTTDRGAEIWNTLIHLVDPSANTALRDRYFHGIDIDFSHCTFVFSYNDPSKLNPVLLDRIRRVSMDPPSDEERRAIVVNHLIPRVQKRLGQWSGGLSQEAVQEILNRAPKGTGMRDVERDVDHVLSTARLCLVCGDDRSLVGTSSKVMNDADEVDVQFAREVLAPKTRDDAPAHMYL